MMNPKLHLITVSTSTNVNKINTAILAREYSTKRWRNQGLGATTSRCISWNGYEVIVHSCSIHIKNIYH